MEQRQLVAVRLPELVAASRRFSASLSDRSRVRTVGIVAATNLVSQASNPTSLFYMALHDGGPPAVLGWTSPIRTQVKDPVGRWANWWRSIQHQELERLGGVGEGAVEAARRHVEVDPAVAQEVGRVAGREGDDVGAGDHSGAGRRQPRARA